MYKSRFLTEVLNPNVNAVLVPDDSCVPHMEKILYVWMQNYINEDRPSTVPFVMSTAEAIYV